MRATATTLFLVADALKSWFSGTKRRSSIRKQGHLWSLPCSLGASANSALRSWRPEGGSAGRLALPALHVEVADVEGVVFDELAAGFDFFAHELREHFFGFDGVGEVHAEELALGGVHGGLEELAGIHFAETLETFDFEATPADVFDAGKYF